MISFVYTKTDGAEYFSHLDTLRHIDRTLRRAHITVNKSEGFNKHPRIFMNNPLATGVKSYAEYCTVDTNFDGDFLQAFNESAPRGIRCVKYIVTQQKGNFANTITHCAYTAEGLQHFDPACILDESRIEICDQRGRAVDIRPRIYAIEWQNGLLCFTLGCGENNLRPDLFCNYLASRFGGEATNITKTQSFGSNVF